MPCNCDHMEPRFHEEESRNVCQHIVFVNGQLGRTTEDWIVKASKSIYGCESKVHEVTAMLCSMLRNMKQFQIDRIVYNGRSRNSRLLADWWEEHQAADKNKEDEAKKKREQADLKKKAMAKLSKKELAALGLR